MAGVFICKRGGVSVNTANIMNMPNRFARALLAGILTFSYAQAGWSAGGEWPQWRGPNRDGISTEKGLLQDWPDEGPKLAWKATGLGSGYSTVAVTAGKIFTAGDRDDAGFVICLNETDGKPAWTAKLGKAGAPGWGGFAGPRATPTVDKDVLFAVDQWGELVCLESGTGKEKWRKDYSKDFGGKLPEWGFSESPLVDGDQVVVTPGGADGAIVALDKKTGAVKWRSTAFKDSAHYASLTIATIGGVRQYLQLTAASVVGVSPDDGKVLWRTDRKGTTAVIPTPLHKGNFVYVTSGYGNGCNLFEITGKAGSFQVTQKYMNKVMVNHHGGVVMVGDYIYGYSDGKGWTCQDFKTGEAKWQEKALRKGSITYADNRLYLRQEDEKGTIMLIEASPSGFKSHGKFNPPDRSDKNSWPHPVVAGGKLYIRDQDVLLCFDVKGK